MPSAKSYTNKARPGRFIRQMPRDMYGKRFSIGGFVFAAGWGIGKVLGIARGEAGALCLVVSFDRSLDTTFREEGPEGAKTKRWRTWLVPLNEAMSLGKRPYMDKGDPSVAEKARNTSAFRAKRMKSRMVVESARAALEALKEGSDGAEELLEKALADMRAWDDFRASVPEKSDDRAFYEAYSDV